MRSSRLSRAGWIGLCLIGMAGLVGAGLVLISGPDGDAIPLRVSLGARSVSKLPFMIALDQGLFEKYGLDVSLDVPPPDFKGGIEVNADGLLARTWRHLRYQTPPPFDILVDGHTPYMVLQTLQAREPRRVALAGTDCVVRAFIVARPGIETLEELKGKRIGISGAYRTTTGFVARLLARRMGWDPLMDVSIVLNGRDVDALRDGVVDAIVAAERVYGEASREGFPTLVDTRTWNEPIAGNSILVEPEWLTDPTNREAARRFIQASVEGIALFHNNRELALEVLERWNGVRDRDYAEIMYDRGQWTSREPFPCYDGIAKTLELYDSNELRRYSPEDFYDDSLIRELAESGFVRSFYRDRQ
jgi:ABC-type nitrate/sulfonate/bicarbonate transport system substrate-binding protein